ATAGNRSAVAGLCSRIQASSARSMRAPMGANGQRVSSRSRVMARTGKLTRTFYDAGPGRAAVAGDARFGWNSRAGRPFAPFAHGPCPCPCLCLCFSFLTLKISTPGWILQTRRAPHVDVRRFSTRAGCPLEKSPRRRLTGFAFGTKRFLWFRFFDAHQRNELGRAAGEALLIWLFFARCTKRETRNAKRETRNAKIKGFRLRRLHFF